MGYICEGSTEFEQFIYFTLPLVPLTLCDSTLKLNTEERQNANEKKIAKPNIHLA